MRLDTAPLALWESLARADAGATFFQTPAWHHLAAAHFGAESVPLLFNFPGGPACLPLLRDRRWGRARYFSPFGVYTALLCPRTLSAPERSAIESVLARLNLHLVSSPFAANVVRPGKAIPARVQAVDLRGLDPADAARGWDPDPRRRLRIARENGLRAHAEGRPSDWQAYRGLYRKSLRRWGRSATSVHPDSLFEALRRASEAGAGIRLWLAGRDEAAAGFVAFYHNGHACVWHGAADAACFRLGAVQLLYHDMMADAARRGFRVFDLLGSAGLPALESFKASLGARTLEYDSYLNRAGVMGRLAGLKDGLLGRMKKRRRGRRP